jgi:CMP-N,N'-diacetyllegionaminic acid synthase
MHSSKSSKCVVAIVPARGGSKGIPGKNIRNLAGKPLIEWTIDAALKSCFIERVIVTTDCREIASIALAAGAEVPFIRPSELGFDETAAVLPILHAVEWLEENEKYTPPFVIDLQPTSPLRNTGDIDGALDLLFKSQFDAVVGMAPVRQNPYWMQTLRKDGSMEYLLGKDLESLRRQDLPTVYLINGAIYAIKREVFLKERTLFPAKTTGYVMPQERSLDIDSKLDMDMAQILIKNL